LLPEPLPGIDLPMLVRRTLDDWFANPAGYEGYLPDAWYFLVATLLRATGVPMVPSGTSRTQSHITQRRQHSHA
jgi:hypothetical protein